MSSMTAQIAVGQPDRYHGGIRPTHVLWLSENDRPGWILEETWRELYGEPSGALKDQESPPWTQQSIRWVPSAPEHILEDGILLIAVHVLCDEAVRELARKQAPDLLESTWMDLSKLSGDMLAQLREQCLSIELDYKLVVTVLGGSSLEEQLPVLERYPMQVEVCTVTYSTVWGGFVGPEEAEVRGSLTASWSREGPMPNRYRAVNLASSLPGALSDTNPEGSEGHRAAADARPAMRGSESHPGHRVAVWRAKINSGRPDLKGHWDGAKKYCRRAGVVGVGWGQPGLHSDASIDDVITAIEAPSGQRAVRRLKEDVRIGDLVWTRETKGDYWLGRVTGEWRYDDSDEARRWDLNNVRPCTWLDESMRDYQVPGAVVRSFTGPGQTLTRVRRPAARKMTELIFRRATNPQVSWPPMDPNEIIEDLLDPIDVEDIVLLRLQADGWVLLPSTRMGDTPLYEAALRHRADGRLAVVAVKSGGEEVPVPDVVAEVRDRDPQAEIFVYSTDNAYTDPPPEKHGAVPLTREQLVDFMREHPELLPPRITRWIRGK